MVDTSKNTKIEDQIKSYIDKLDMEEFNCLSELGKYAKDKDSGF